jgi:phosphoserine aminotransferase
MKYLLFISFNDGLMHNCIYNTLSDLHESLVQLVQEEELDAKTEEIPTLHSLKKHLSEHDDYVGWLTNNTWYHVQSHPVFGV